MVDFLYVIIIWKYSQSFSLRVTVFPSTVKSFCSEEANCFTSVLASSLLMASLPKSFRIAFFSFFIVKRFCLACFRATFIAFLTALVLEAEMSDVTCFFSDEEAVDVDALSLDSGCSFVGWIIVSCSDCCVGSWLFVASAVEAAFASSSAFRRASCLAFRKSQISPKSASPFLPRMLSELAAKFLNCFGFRGTLSSVAIVCIWCFKCPGAASTESWTMSIQISWGVCFFFFCCWGPFFS